jgi:UDP-N-acetylmuramoyl-tripeptide--D-alanyl-D-alanine ligase
MNIKDLYTKYRESGKVSTDTRSIPPNCIFFALKGERFNANEFAGEAIAKGARYAVVDEEKYAVDDACILVSDVLKCLQQLARFHRDQLNIPIIALTGSNGKTTSKELVNVVLSCRYRTYATKGNLNNHIGVPLSVLAIEDSTEIAVIEMGANHLGEISLLCEIANPTHGFITNIGKAHIGTFGGFENIIRGKSELYQHLITNKGSVFINSKNPILVNMAKRFESPMFYPAEGDYYHAELLTADPYVKFRAENGDEVQTHLIGTYNFENITAALCIGKYFDVDPRQANNAVADYIPSNMRSQVITKGSNTIILDAYNANPSSMQAAIENLSSMKSPHKVLILGDMFELEGESEREHRLLGALIKERNFSDVYLCGTLIKTAHEIIPSAKYFNRKEDLIEALKKEPVKNATVLVKASRGIGLESVVDYL